MEEKQLQLKKELIAKLKNLAESSNLTNVLNEVSVIKKQWRRPYDDESLYEKELQDEFDKYLAIISSKESEILVSVEEKKNEIIKNAKEVLKMTNYRQATNKMDELMTQWKAAGYINKEKDDELWTSFKEIRDEFYAKRKEYYAQLTETFSANKAQKEALVEKIKEIGQMENIKEANKLAENIMNDWKAVGTCGRKEDEALWQAFNSERKAFFKKKNEYYAKLKESYGAKAEAKKEIIAKAKKCLAFSEFTQEEKNTMKELRAEWKAIGSAGRDNEETLWNEFNEVMNKYYDNMKYYG